MVTVRRSKCSDAVAWAPCVLIAVSTTACTSRHADLEINAIHVTFQDCPSSLGEAAVDRFVPWRDVSTDGTDDNMTADEDPIEGKLTLCVTPGLGQSSSCQEYGMLPTHDVRKESTDLIGHSPDGTLTAGTVETDIAIDDAIHVHEGPEVSTLTLRRAISFEVGCIGTACGDVSTGSCQVIATVDASSYDDLGFVRRF